MHVNLFRNALSCRTFQWPRLQRQSSRPQAAAQAASDTSTVRHDSVPPDCLLNYPKCHQQRAIVPRPRTRVQKVRTHLVQNILIPAYVDFWSPHHIAAWTLRGEEHRRFCQAPNAETCGGERKPLGKSVSGARKYLSSVSRCWAIVLPTFGVREKFLPGSRSKPPRCSMVISLGLQIAQSRSNIRIRLLGASASSRSS